MTAPIQWSCGVLVLVFGAGSFSSGSTVAIEGRIHDLSSGDPLVRRSAAVALGEAADRAAVPALVNVLADRDADVRREAAKALGFIKDGLATERLIGALSDSDANVRFYAAYALGEIKDARASDELLRALRDAEWNVRNQAAWSLREIGGPSATVGAIAALRDAATDDAIVGWLLKHGDVAEAVTRLTEALKGADASTRERVVRVLGQMGSPALGALVASLGDSDIVVRKAAIDGLGAIGERKVSGELRAFAAREKDPALRHAAETVADRVAPKPLPASHWSFDGAEPGKDVTGKGSDGKITGCQPSEGRVGRALEFGGNGCIELGKPAALPTANQPITVMAWIKARGPNGVVVARGGAFCGYSLYLKDGVPKFGMRRTADDDAAVIVAGPVPVVGDWVHLAGVIAEDRLELYVNGRLAGAEKTAGPLPGNCGQGMEIGFDVGNSAVEICDHFDGVIDEVKVFQEAVAAEAIAGEAGL